jgi:hypothetical protein
MTSYNLLRPFDLQRVVHPKATSRVSGDHVCVIWLKSVERFSRYAPETTWQVTTFFDLLLTFRGLCTPKGTSRACGDHVYVIWLKSEICSGNYMTSTNLLRPSFHLQRVVHPKATSRACGDHVCVIWLKSVEPFSRYAPEMTQQVTTFFDLLLPFRGSYTPKGTSRACEDHMCVIWLKSVERFSRYAPETTWQVTTFFWPLLPFKKVVHTKRHI